MPVDIQNCIEVARQKLHFTWQKYGEFGHPKVIEQSIILDELINQYNRQIIKKPIE